MQASLDVLIEAYDAMIDWDKRLSREAPFYRKVFEAAGVKSVLDAACGTGRHAAMFASWGLDVVGADVNAAMIEHCRRAHSSLPNLTFEVRSFTQPAARRFDAVICAGNSLALAGDADQVAVAVRAMASSLNPGGVLVLHVLNMLSREEGPVRWDKCKRVNLSSGEALLIKGTHRVGAYGYVDFLLTDLSRPQAQLTVDSVRFLTLHGDELAALCPAAGCSDVRIFSGYGMDEYVPDHSADLIMVATRCR